MIRRIKRPEDATTPSGLNKLKTSNNIIPVHILFKNSERIFAEASANITINSAYDYDTQHIFEGVNVQSFLELQNLWRASRAICRFTPPGLFLHREAWMGSCRSAEVHRVKS